MDRGSSWIRYDAASRRLALTVRVQPNARRNEIVGLHGDALKIKVAAPAVDSKANTALVEFLSEVLGISRSAVTIRRGGSSRSKLLEIAGGPELRVKLEAIAAGRSTNHDPRTTPTAASDRPLASNK